MIQSIIDKLLKRKKQEEDITMPIELPQEDKTRIVHYEKGVCGTDGYDSCHSMAIYQLADGTYELVVTDRDFQQNVVSTYKIEKTFVDAINSKILEEKIYQFIDAKGYPVDGGFESLRFLYKGKPVAVSLENFKTSQNTMWIIGNELAKGMVKENLIQTKTK